MTWQTSIKTTTIMATKPNLPFLQNSIFSCKVLRKYKVTNFLFVKIIILTIPCIHYKVMKLNLAICLVLSLSSWWQLRLGNSCGLRCQNGVMANDAFTCRKTKSCKQHVLVVLRLASVTQVLLWLNGVKQIVNDQKQYTTKHYRKPWDRTDFATVK